MEKICFKIVEWGVYLVLLTPFIFFREYFYPFVSPKTFFFRIVIDIILIAYVLLVLLNSKYRPRITPLTAAVTVFLAVLTLTSVIGLNFERSFFGLFARGDGLLTFFHLFAFYIILTSCFKERKYWERILTVSIAVCVFVCFSVLFLESSCNRGGGTLGNPSFFSAYLLFNLFFSLIMLVIKTGIHRVFYGLTFAVFLFFLFSNPGGAFTKGAVAAFFFAIIFLIFSCLFYFNRKKAVSLLLLVLILLALGSVAAIQLDFAREKALDFWQSNSVQSRAGAWQVSWQAWQERFWFGWGPENFSISFAKHFDPQLALSTDSWFDRAHNVILDIGVSSGIFGVLSYLLILFLAFFGLIKKILPKDVKEEKTVIYFIMIALLAAYFFQNLWVFDTVSSYMMFFLSLAFINFLVYPEKEQTRKKTGFLAVFTGTVLIFLAAFSLYFGSIQPARASRLIDEGLDQPPEKSILSFQKAFQVFPLANIEGSVYLSRSINSLLEEDHDKEVIHQGFDLAEKHLKKAVSENPLDCWLHLSLAEHYNRFYEFSGDHEKLILAEQSLEKVFEISPKLQKAYFTMSQTKFLQEKQEEALEFLQEAKKLEPRYKKAILLLIKGYMEAGEHESALAELKLLEGLDLTCRDAEALAEVRTVFVEAGKSIDVFIPIYAKGIEDNPEKLCFRMDLVGAYLKIGETEKAREALEEWPSF